MSKAPLALMEQVIMTLVFALAAALCVQAFVLSNSASQAAAARDSALREAQSAAELLKSCRGDFSRAAQLLQATATGESLMKTFDENWESSPEACYMLTAQRLPASREKLGEAEVLLCDRAGKTLARLPVAWQEETR